jgi:hypothetical protein
MSELKRVLRISVATGIAISAAVALAVPGAQAAGTPGWRFAAVYAQVPALQSVSASGAANALAVGHTDVLSLFASRWDGKTWQTIAAEPQGLIYPQVLGAVAAATTGARAWVFVVCMAPADEGGESAAAAVEWTGTSWSAVHNFASVSGLSTAIASGPDDVWGFGATGSAGQTPWAVRYNGKGWSAVAIPVIAYQASGSAAAGDWVTGTVARSTRVEVLHWSRGAWRNVALPRMSVPKGEQELPGLIAAASPASVWATVEVGPPSGAGRLTYLLLHWNGTAWSKVPLPKGVSVYGLASDGHGGSWVASYTVNKPGVNLSGLVMYHYSGGHWTHVPAPAKSGFVTTLGGSNMELIPGTTSVLAAASLTLPGITEGAILKYGP